MTTPSPETHDDELADKPEEYARHHWHDDALQITTAGHTWACTRPDSFAD